MIKNKRGQLEGVFWFFAVVFLIFLLAPLMLKIPNMFFGQLVPIAGNSTSPQAATSVNYLDTKMNQLWDEMIMILFFGLVIVLFFSAFMIDVHPAFVVIYIAGLVFLFVGAMPMWDAVNNMYDNALFTDQVS